MGENKYQYVLDKAQHVGKENGCHVEYLVITIAGTTGDQIWETAFQQLSI